MKRISILGLGWYGRPLAEYLKSKGFSVCGSKSTEEGARQITEMGIPAYKLDFNSGIEGSEELFEADVAVVNFPPSVGDYSNAMQEIYMHLKKNGIRNTIFISSTSVYANLNREVTEVDDRVGEATRRNGQLLREVEDQVQEIIPSTTILRFGGLYGSNRHPVRYFAGKENVPNGASPVNMIHLDACIKITYEVIRQQMFGEVFNAVEDAHPNKQEFYTQAAKKMDLPLPHFLDEKGDYKIVSNEKLKKTLGIENI